MNIATALAEIEQMARKGADRALVNAESHSLVSACMQTLRTALSVRSPLPSVDDTKHEGEEKPAAANEVARLIEKNHELQEEIERLVAPSAAGVVFCHECSEHGYKAPTEGLTDEWVASILDLLIGMNGRNREAAIRTLRRHMKERTPATGPALVQSVSADHADIVKRLEEMAGAFRSSIKATHAVVDRTEKSGATEKGAAQITRLSLDGYERQFWKAYRELAALSSGDKTDAASPDRTPDAWALWDDTLNVIAMSDLSKQRIESTRPPKGMRLRPLFLGDSR